MIYISEELAKKIGSLAHDFTDEKIINECYFVSSGGTTIYRDFKHQNLLCGFHLDQNKVHDKNKPEGIHINIMLNGDVFARTYPYYDGELEVIPVYNQRKIAELIESIK